MEGKPLIMEGVKVTVSTLSTLMLLFLLALLRMRELGLIPPLPAFHRLPALPIPVLLSSYNTTRHTCI